jgi:hypothetical protein
LIVVASCRTARRRKAPSFAAQPLRHPDQPRNLARASLAKANMETHRDDDHPDADSIQLDDARVVETWTRSLGITEEDLQRAVATVGTSTGAVYDYLNRTRRT